MFFGGVSCTGFFEGSFQGFFEGCVSGVCKGAIKPVTDLLMWPLARNLEQVGAIYVEARQALLGSQHQHRMCCGRETMGKRSHEWISDTVAQCKQEADQCLRGVRPEHFQQRHPQCQWRCLRPELLHHILLLLNRLRWSLWQGRETIVIFLEVPGFFKLGILRVRGTILAFTVLGLI